MVLQVPIRRVPVISTVWSATITALTPTKWWPTDGSIRSWTASWLQASRSSPRPSTAPSTAAVTRGSRPITTAGNASTPCWGSPRWRPTSTDTWMSRAGPGERERGREETVKSVPARRPARRHLPAGHDTNVRTEPASRLGWRGKLGFWQSQLSSNKFNLNSISSLIIFTVIHVPSLMWSLTHSIFFEKAFFLWSVWNCLYGHQLYPTYLWSTHTCIIRTYFRGFSKKILRDVSATINMYQNGPVLNLNHL